MKKIILLKILIMITLLLSGCWDLIDINKAAIVTGIGIDFNQDKIIYTTQFATKDSLLEEGTGKPLTENITVQGKTVTEAARAVTFSSPVFPLWAHSDIIMLGENLARQDLGLIGDFLLRNRNIRPEAYVVLAYKDTPEKLLNVPVPLSAYSGTGINQLVNINESLEGAYVPVTNIEFLACLTTPGIQPAIPQISLTDNKKLRLNGTAVFRDRRLVGSLNEEESRGYRWLHYNLNKGGMLVIDSPLDKKAVSLAVTRISSLIRPVLKDGKLFFNIKVNTDLILYEQLGQGNLMTDEQRQQMEVLANKEIKRQIKACVRKSQSLNSDILGLGLQTYRYYPEYWHEVEKDWATIYPGLQTNLLVNSLILEGNLINKSVNLRS